LLGREVNGHTSCTCGNDVRIAWWRHDVQSGTHVADGAITDEALAI
jgi:hypothetical protein